MTGAPRIVFDSPWITVYDPWSIPAGFHVLELLFLIGVVLTSRHALARHREGDRQSTFLWLTALFYGVWMEVLSYHTVDNFAHNQFTVMLYHKQLPLYVVMLYPTFIYTAVQTARRFGMGAPGTFFAAGLVVVLLDVPFDILGPDCRWWWWREDAEDPLRLVAHRWLGVPVTSYCWHLLFCGSLALVSERFGRLAMPPSRARRMLGLTAPGVLAALAGAVSIVVGIVTMMPFHLFRGPLGLSDGTFTVTLFVVAAIVFGLARKRWAGAPDGGRLAFVMLWNAAFVLYGVIVWRADGVEDAAWKAAVVALVALSSVVLHTYVHMRGRALGA